MADVTDKLIGDGPGKKRLARKKFWTVNLRFSNEQYHIAFSEVQWLLYSYSRH